MRKLLWVPMMTLCLLLASCGGTGDGETGTDALRSPYRQMTGCTMETEVRFSADGAEEIFILQGHVVPEGESRVEVLAPETAAGVTAVLKDGRLTVADGDICFPAGPLSSQHVSPAETPLLLVTALREGWLLEEGREKWNGVPCVCLTMDSSGENGGKLVSTLWLRRQDGRPVHGEIAVDGQVVLTAEVTAFTFDDQPGTA